MSDKNRLEELARVVESGSQDAPGPAQSAQPDSTGIDCYEL